MTDYRDCPKCGERISPARNYGPHLSAHRRTENAKYRYFNGDTKHPYEFKACRNPDCEVVYWIQKRNDFCSLRCSRLGEFNPNWNDNSVYKVVPRTDLVAWHQKVEKERGIPSFCEHCQSSVDRVYHWANKTGYYDDPYDYIRLCAPCHSKYDTEKPEIAPDMWERLLSIPRPVPEPSKGSDHPRAKLTEDDVLEIRKRCEAGEGSQSIAEDYPVTPSVISNIKARRIWKHV